MNRKSAAKLRKGESSTTIPREGSTSKRMEVVSPEAAEITSKLAWIRYSLCLYESTGCSKRTAIEAASYGEQQLLKVLLSSYICYFEIFIFVCKSKVFAYTYVIIFIERYL